MSQTPRPWRADHPDEENPNVWGPDDRAVAHDVFNPADAHLIAAAPDLLEAARNALHLISPIKRTALGPECAIVRHRLRAAIAKATSGQS